MMLFRQICLALLFSVLYLIMPLAKAQGNLQFNRIVSDTITCTATGTVTKTVTVPAGKVWKLEHASLLNMDSTPADVSYNSGSTTFFLGTYTLLPFLSTSASTGNGKFPIWLGAGNYNLTLYYSSSIGFPLVGSINGIEFNVVP